MDSLRTLLRIAVGVLALALFCLPAIIALRLGWLSLGSGAGSSLERWVVFAVASLGWAVLVVMLLAWCNERLGLSWQAHERAPRPRRRERRRRAAGLRLLEGQQGAPGGAAQPRRKGRP